MWTIWMRNWAESNAIEFTCASNFCCHLDAHSFKPALNIFPEYNKYQYGYVTISIYINVYIYIQLSSLLKKGSVFSWKKAIEVFVSQCFCRIIDCNKIWPGHIWLIWTWNLKQAEAFSLKSIYETQTSPFHLNWTFHRLDTEQSYYLLQVSVSEC